MKTWIAKWKAGKINIGNPTHVKKLLIVFVAGTMLAAAFFLYATGGGETAEPVTVIRENDGPDSAAERESAAKAAVKGTATPPAIYVDVAGAVNKPMVIELPAGSRVFEALEAAGGLTESADARYINRATVLSDGDRIYVPGAGEITDESDLPPSAGATAGGAPGGAEGKININTADGETLQQLNGVGPATARKILDYRAQNGKFTSIEDIQNVSGIGAKTFEKMKDRLTV
ncbi:MAG: helix-hairpin-helix domain-containing protein [Clostridiales Family XIII bacterium]|jgi:competence protein ComEA|nr:helix-hairpin-helix domain-containing protein [Clostridiales Family XIII bacterium]